jgi:hypothetical protein
MDGQVGVNKSFACLPFLAFPAFLAFPVLVLAVFGVQVLRLGSS